MMPSEGPQPMQFLASSPHQQTPSPAAQYHQQPPPSHIIYQAHIPGHQMMSQFHPNAPQPQYPNPFTIFPHNPNQ